MKKLIFMALVAASLTSCEYFGKGGRTFETTDGVKDIASDLKSKFGDKAAYTNISMSYHDGIGTSILATGAADVNSGKLIEKLKQKGVWQDKAEVTLEITGDAKPKDFTFTLDQVGDLKTIPDLVKSSIAKVEKEKNMKDLVPTSVYISMPSRINGPEDVLSIVITVEPENGGTDFTLTYNAKGEFQHMHY